MPGNVLKTKLYLEADGLILSADDPWWKPHFPPNGWVCGCYIESPKTLRTNSVRTVGYVGKRNLKGERYEVLEGAVE